MKKKPIVTTQHIMTGQEDKSKCSDSAVAQQLTAANAIKASKQKIFRNLFSFMIISTFFFRFPSEEVIKFGNLNEQYKKTWELPAACPTL